MGRQPARRQPLNTDQLRRHLLDWYRANKRDLPWRKSKDAYRIWISEVMLQQTTTQAVIPYYEKFLNRFPKLKDLALAPESEVLKYWAGLGYYSRARNLHKAAKELNSTGFPKTADQLIEYPGFGPYTSRSVASLAFEDPVGVLDGNVIRILSRVYGDESLWWTTESRKNLQSKADELASVGLSSEVNQAMMELGATVCTPQSPSCFLCPWNRECRARREGRETELPIKKPKTASHILLWQPRVAKNKNKIAFVTNSYAPFLKGAKIFPGSIQTLNQRPEKFDYKHTITKYDIYTQLSFSENEKAVKSLKTGDYHWLELQKISEEVPYSLITKALKHLKLLN